ncbi:hypothetical protein [Streptosporangium lutulentum]|uniref:Uncharacterized protein n=1 Tax=Streptosporangium lutulentum TaxID=1461250 RepID=A0ABT9QU76_9ACTN|nr:hypothetical protein [Streptosporangium lutulentum]MDP9850315.1 hypothetical protein [Streptosporangium lutulentum]
MKRELIICDCGCRGTATIDAGSEAAQRATGPDATARAARHTLVTAARHHGENR